ncbi:hypothetical protein CBE01nite_25980 [Clostridium beijerinckii]|uniref:DUF5673 domain-containing protein n=1 Tax=Clostridium beijerinckii TaxID=1520 RepID=A0AB74VCD9_CLOBE|nr:DUF5673 domain-containing protein [Clostridium beijerinckii]NRZ28367.1 hypothetical protein [Clostridium beijerinckii]NYB95858.1 hypothetical protein [Clostridium beijerinckii]OOM25185.1 hypothetical protein CLBEI_16850 [Clostridium beijerinckii]QUN34084.1 hypothetical protein KEC93_19380 [Clostridium beijerinckii]SQB00998.1 Uncharacterised protein [Clostridium beijerinckii]
MSEFYGFSIFAIVLFILGTRMLLKDLYTSCIHGRSILKVEKGIGLAIFWLGSIIVWCLLLRQSVKLYVRHENNGIINNIVTNIFWIEFSISNIIKSLRSLEIRENGIYKSGYFYKWSKIRSYNWTTPNTIEFKVSSFLKINSSIEFTINEEYKAKVEEVIQKSIAL